MREKRPLQTDRLAAIERWTQRPGERLLYSVDCGEPPPQPPRPGVMWWLMLAGDILSVLWSVRLLLAASSWEISLAGIGCNALAIVALLRCRRQDTPDGTTNDANQGHGERLRYSTGPEPEEPGPHGGM